MDKHGFTLGIYLHHTGAGAWLYDVTEKDNAYLLHFHPIENFYNGFHSFTADRVSDETFTLPDEDLYNTVRHKNRDREEWLFLGRLVRQGEFYQIV